MMCTNLELLVSQLKNGVPGIGTITSLAFGIVRAPSHLPVKIKNNLWILEVAKPTI
jgi:hypothetical protein